MIFFYILKLSTSTWLLFSSNHSYDIFGDSKPTEKSVKSMATAEIQYPSDCFNMYLFSACLLSLFGCLSDTCLPVYLSVSQSDICLSVCLSVCLLIYLCHFDYLSGMNQSSSELYFFFMIIINSYTVFCSCDELLIIYLLLAFQNCCFVDKDYETSSYMCAFPCAILLSLY